MIYTTFEQTDYGFVLLDINKKQSDKNRIRKNKIERFGPNRPLQCRLFRQSENCVYFHKERIKTRKKYMT